MLMDKSKDYLYQNSVRTIWYRQKTQEGDASFVTSSESTFKDDASQVCYVRRDSLPRTSPSALQNESARFDVWREPWERAGFVSDPGLSDRFFADGAFWNVNEVNYTDMDDSGKYQRFTLTCTGSNKGVQA